MESESKMSATSLKRACVSCGEEFSGEITLCPHDGTLLTPLAQQPVIGAVIADRYEIQAVMGQGGMGMVFKARHMLMKRTVAIKMLHPHLVASASALKRFQKEAEALSALSHPNILTVFDFGLTAQGNPFLVMDFLEGTSLAAVLDEAGALDVDRALSIFAQTASGLAHAHQKGVIHRDLKPANIMLIDFDGIPDFVKIVDFGIAKIVPQTGEESSQLTNTGDVFGSPMYMSPEQCRGLELDMRTDIYSLGCVMYRTLTGMAPFVGNDLLECMYKQVNDSPYPFSDVAPELGLPEELQAIVFKAMMKEPGDRYQSLAELREDLDTLRQTGTVLVSTLPGETGTRPPLKATTGERSTTQPSTTSPPNANQTSAPGTTPPGTKPPGTTQPPAAAAASQDAAATTPHPEEGRPSSSRLIILTSGPRDVRIKLALYVAVPLMLVLIAIIAVASLSGKHEGGKQSGAPGAQTAQGGNSDYDKPYADGTSAYEAGHYKQAMNSLEKAVSQAEKFGEADPRLSQALNELGLSEYQLGDYDKAADDLKRAFTLREHNEGGDTPAVAESMANYGKVLIAQRQYDQAEAFLRKSLDIRNARFGQDSIESADSLHGLGILSLNKGNYEEAVTFLNKDYNNLHKHLAGTDPAKAEVANDLGQAYQLMGNKSAAETWMRKGLAIRELKLDDDNPAIADSLTALATFDVAARKFAEATRLYQRAIKIQEKAFGSDNAVVGKNYWNLGVVYYNQGQFSVALPFLEQSLAIANAVPSMNNPTEAEIEGLIADCKRRISGRRGRAR